MRVWRTSVNVNGTPVWVGQISRDIGVRLTSKILTTHKIDPEVDSARWYLMQDMFYSQSLRRYAFVKGVGAATPLCFFISWSSRRYDALNYLAHILWLKTIQR